MHRKKKGGFEFFIGYHKKDRFWIKVPSRAAWAHPDQSGPVYQLIKSEKRFKLFHQLWSIPLVRSRLTQG